MGRAEVGLKHEVPLGRINIDGRIIVNVRARQLYGGLL
jgi:hypothetical protein